MEGLNSTESTARRLSPHQADSQPILERQLHPWRFLCEFTVILQADPESAENRLFGVATYERKNKITFSRNSEISLQGTFNPIMEQAMSHKRNP